MLISERKATKTNMLKLNRSHHFSLPHLTLPTTGQMQFQPVPITEDDELARAIVEDTQEHDNQWELAERPDMGELTAFWSKVEADVAQDPEWFNFSED